MRLLFIGGTRFVGRAMAEAALARGHQVDLFHRGAAQPGVLDGARHLQGDRHGDLSALAASAPAGAGADAVWDAVIDVCGFRPHEVDAMATALQGRVGRHVFVSSISVYDAAIPAGATEGAPLASPALLDGADPRTVPIDGRSYGALKVLCEQAVRRHDPQALVLRPSYVFGPHDPSGRFPAWVQRLAAPPADGWVDAPGPAEAPMQWIDARDLADFTLRAVEAGTAGTFHLAGPEAACTWGGMLQTLCDTVAPAGTRLRWLDVAQARARTAAAAAADPQAPPLYPLWAGSDPSGLLAVDTAAARAHGLRCRPLAETARDVKAWLGP